jgi:hypothetical protein
MMETIVVYYSPLAATKVAAYVGLGLAYHMAIIYTNAAGQSFGVSSGPSNQSTQQTPAHALTAIVDTAHNRPSDFGTLTSDPKNNHPFKMGAPEDYYTQDFDGQAFPHAVALAGPDLSSPWRSIVDTYAAIGRLHLTYSPISQNSNSMAGAALRGAGIPIPFSVTAKFAPAAFTYLPRNEDELLNPAGK